MTKWWCEKLTDYMRDVNEPQSVREVFGGCFGDSPIPSVESVRNWLRFGVRFGVLRRVWNKEYKYAWRHTTGEADALAILDAIEESLADLRRRLTSGQTVP